MVEFLEIDDQPLPPPLKCQIVKIRKNSEIGTPYYRFRALGAPLVLGPLKNQKCLLSHMEGSDAARG